MTAAFFVGALLGVSRAQTITTPPENQTAIAGASVTFTVAATGTGLTYQWRKDGAPLAGATSATLTVANIQPQNAGVYTAVVTSGAKSASASAILGFAATAKVTGAGTEVGADILHPTGNTYDQVLLQGPAAAVTADAGQVTRISYIDLNDDIVQVEFAGPGTLTLSLDNSSGPAPPAKYVQPNVSYMKGHASIVIAGATELTNVSVFSVGRANAVNQSLFRSDVTYDGLADIACLAIVGGNGKFGGLRSANASYFATKGVTGVYAPGIQFDGPIFVGDVNAFDAATPVLLIGSGGDVRITGGQLRQTNSQPVQVGGLPQLQFVNGSTSHGTLFPFQSNQGVLQQNGVDVTAQLAPRPSAKLYVAQLRPDPGAASSTASGYATIVINADGTAAVSATFSNLSSPETSAHLQLGRTNTYVLGLPLGQVAGTAWNFAPSSAYKTNDLINALNQGDIFVGFDSARFPAGELRGNFVAATGSTTFTAPAAPPALPVTALTQPTQTDAARFLMQATFGPTSADLTDVTTRGITAWLDTQMSLTATPASQLWGGIKADIAAFPNPDPAVIPNSAPYRSGISNLNAAWFKFTCTAPDQLRQRVAFALSEIFVVGAMEKLIWNAETKGKYYDLLVNGAFGNYRQLLENITLDPAMGLWLSHWGNPKANPARGTSPDENYAREIMQLFSIGLVQLQPDGSLLLDSAGQPIPTYDQATVSETAKVLTGWTGSGLSPGTLDPSIFNSYFPGWVSYGFKGDDHELLKPMGYYDQFHDKTAKRLVSLQQVPLSRSAPTLVPANQAGPQDLKILLDALANHPNTGPFICRQLIQRLVTSNPSSAYLYRVAQVFANDGTGTRGNLGAVVRAILTDYEARSPDVLANVGFGKIKEPLIRLTGFFRALNFRAPNGRYLDSYYGEFRGGLGFVTQAAGSIVYIGSGFHLYQAPLNALTVFNFFSPDYSPPGPLAAAGLVAPELQIADTIAVIQAPNVILDFMLRDTSKFTQPPAGLSPFLMPDYSAFLPNARNPTALADQLNLLFCANQMTPATRSLIVGTLQSHPASATDIERVQTALEITVSSPDGAMQK